MKSASKEIRETKDMVVNGYVITLVKLEENMRPLPSYMGLKGWALQSMCKMKRTIYPIQIKRTK